MPDLMRGETLANYAHDPDLKNQFLSKWSTWQDLEDDIRTLFSYIDSLGIAAIGCLGFCWGVWVGFKASAAGFPLKAGAGAHPSIRLEEYHGSTPEKLSELVNCPMMLASARNDPPNVQEGGEVERILQAKFPQSTVKSFHDVDHGWVSRGDLQDPVVSQNVNDALMAITHFLQQNI